jgi:hypothetical protein
MACTWVHYFNIQEQAFNPLTARRFKYQHDDPCGSVSTIGKGFIIILDNGKNERQYCENLPLITYVYVEAAGFQKSNFFNITRNSTLAHI